MVVQKGSKINQGNPAITSHNLRDPIVDSDREKILGVQQMIQVFLTFRKTPRETKLYIFSGWLRSLSPNDFDCNPHQERKKSKLFLLLRDTSQQITDMYSSTDMLIFKWALSSRNIKSKRQKQIFVIVKHWKRLAQPKENNQSNLYAFDRLLSSCLK